MNLKLGVTYMRVTNIVEVNYQQLTDSVEGYGCNLHETWPWRPTCKDKRYVEIMNFFLLTSQLFLKLLQIYEPTGDQE